MPYTIHRPGVRHFYSFGPSLSGSSLTGYADSYYGLC